MSTLDSNFQEGKYYDSDTESDSSSDEVEEDSPGTTTKVINERAPLWNGRELQALVLLKDRWVSADSEGRDKVLKEAMDKLVELEPRPDVKKLKDKLKYWFRRKARRRQDYGVGHKPSFKTMVGYYCEGEIWDQLRKEYPVGEGEKFKVEIGKWNAMAARVQKDIRTNPLRKKDKDMLEKKREEWVTKGMPKEQRRKAADKSLASEIRKFNVAMYVRFGARLVTLVAHRSSTNQVCVGNLDHNNLVGKKKKEFLVRGMNKIAEPYMTAWTKWAHENLTDDEEGNEVEETVGMPGCRLNRKKPDISFKYNEMGEPLLPRDCDSGDLDDKKHIMRCFLKAHYAIALGVDYPLVSSAPPWGKMEADGPEFFEGHFVPVNIKIRDPSKMSEDSIRKCLARWKEAQERNETAFQFRQVWRSKTRTYEPALLPEPRSPTDEEGSGEETAKSKRVSKRAAGKQRKAKSGKKKVKEEEETEIGLDGMLGEGVIVEGGGKEDMKKDDRGLELQEDGELKKVKKMRKKAKKEEGEKQGEERVGQTMNVDGTWTLAGSPSEMAIPPVLPEVGMESRLKMPMQTSWEAVAPNDKPIGDAVIDPSLITPVGIVGPAAMSMDERLARLERLIMMSNPLLGMGYNAGVVPVQEIGPAIGAPQSHTPQGPRRSARVIENEGKCKKPPGGQKRKMESLTSECAESSKKQKMDEAVRRSQDTEKKRPRPRPLKGGAAKRYDNEEDLFIKKAGGSRK